MSLSSLGGIHNALRPNAQWALDVAAAFRVPVRVTSVFRGWNAQQRLRDRFERCVAQGRFGRPGPCRWPANRPGDSAHNFGFAWDSVTPAVYQQWWTRVRVLAGFEVLPNDPPHAQLPNWRSFRPRP